jgi:hypothetical protein
MTRTMIASIKTMTPIPPKPSPPANNTASWAYPPRRLFNRQTLGQVSTAPAIATELMFCTPDTRV